MCKSQIIESLLKKIFQTVERILANSETITSPSFYLLTPSGMERLESTCMLLIAIGEGVKGVDKLTDKKLLSFYPEMDWKGVMGMRDIIAHHYFDLDAEIVYDVIKRVSRNFVGIIFYTRKVLLTSHYEKRLFEYASQPRVAGSDIRLLSYLWS